MSERMRRCNVCCCELYEDESRTACQDCRPLLSLHGSGPVERIDPPDLKDRLDRYSFLAGMELPLFGGVNE